jgi:rod shape-determining protein MreB and related proteins
MKRLKTKVYKYRKFLPNFSLNGFFGMFSFDCGIDLGTANTLVWVSGKGIVIREPSAVARNKKTKEILAIGASAKKMFGRAPSSLEIIRPLKDGVISDFDATAAMLSHYINKVHESQSLLPKVPKPRVVIGIPGGVTEVEKKAVADAAVWAGAREVHLIEEPMAAAIGAGLAVSDAEGTLIVDIGGGTTEIAVISLGGVVVGRSIRMAGDKLNEAIIHYVRLKYSLLLGESTAEIVKMTIGTVRHKEEEKFFTVRGRDLESGLPKSVELSSGEVKEALSPIVAKIVEEISDTIEETPPELVSDIMEHGITLAGGGSLLDGIDELIAKNTKMPVVIAPDAISCVVKGCGKVLEDPELLHTIRVTSGRRY